MSDDLALDMTREYFLLLQESKDLTAASHAESVIQNRRNRLGGYEISPAELERKEKQKANNERCAVLQAALTRWAQGEDPLVALLRDERAEPELKPADLTAAFFYALYVPLSLKSSVLGMKHWAANDAESKLFLDHEGSYTDTHGFIPEVTPIDRE